MSYSFNNLTLSGSLDSTGTLNIGTGTATAINLGKAGVTTTFPGPISTSQPASFDDIDTSSATTMLIGKANATKVDIGAADITTEIKGSLNTASIDTSATLEIGKTTATKVELGRAGQDTEVKGTLTIPAPLSDTHAATKAYVDSTVQGLDVKPSVDLKTIAALPSFTYNNGSSGVGATLTATSNGALTVDGVLTTTAMTIVVTEHTSENGIYTVTQVGDGSNPYILTRAPYADTISKVTKGLFVHVLAGTESGMGMF
jgi:hypothetical protein